MKGHCIAMEQEAFSKSERTSFAQNDSIKKAIL